MDILNSILSNNNTNLSVSSVSENSNNLHMTDTESSVLSIKEFYPTQFNLNGMAHSKQDIANDEDKSKFWKVFLILTMIKNLIKVNILQR